MNGYMSRVFNLEKKPEDWGAGGVPITMLLNMERRHGKDKPVIKKALVEIDGPVFKYFKSQYPSWQTVDMNANVAPIQYFGPDEVINTAPLSVQLKKGLLPSSASAKL